MTRPSPGPRFATARPVVLVRTLVAAVALAAALAMLAVPHGHADVRAERSCTVCQVVRAGGAPVEPVATVSAPVPAPPALLAETALARGPEAAPLLGPSPPRGPPAPPRTS